MSDGQYLGSDLESTHEDLVEQYLDSHPWSVVGEIRDGIEATQGVRIERVQSRLHSIERRRHVHRRSRGEGSVLEYRLGAQRTEPRRKVCGIEATYWVGEDVEVKVQRAHVDDPRVEAEMEGLRALVEDYLRTRILPLVTPPPEPQGSQDTAVEDDEYEETLAELWALLGETPPPVSTRPTDPLDLDAWCC